jgi:hypothetical protein
MADANSFSIQGTVLEIADSRPTSQEIQHTLRNPKVCLHSKPDEPHSPAIHPNRTLIFDRHDSSGWQDGNHSCTLVRSACLLHVDFFLGLFFEPEDVADMFLQNIGWFSTDYTALYPRRHNYRWEPQTLQTVRVKMFTSSCNAMTQYPSTNSSDKVQAQLLMCPNNSSWSTGECRWTPTLLRLYP